MSYIGNTPSETFHTATSQVFNGDGSTTEFTLEKRVNRAEDLEVFVNNIQQQPTVAYSANNTTLTFTEAPDSATGNIYVVYRMFAQENTFNAIHDFTDDVTFTGTNGNVVFDKSDDALEFADNVKAVFGTGGDLTIQHNGNHSVIKDGGTGNLELAGSVVAIKNGARTENGIVFTQNGSVELYHDNVKKFETTSTGATLTGELVVDDFRMTTGANSLLKFTSADGSEGYQLKANVSNTADFGLLIEDLGNNDIAKFLDGGECLLTHNHITRFQTTSTGATISGDLTLTSTDAGVTGGPILKLIRDSASPEVSDRIGRIEFKGDSSTGVERTYVAIEGGIGNPSNTAEAGFIQFIVSADGALNTSHKSTPLVMTDNFVGFDTGAMTVTTSSVLNFDAANTITIESNTGVTLDANVTVVGHVLPDANDVYDLGSSSKQWRDIYTGDINLNNTKTRDNEVDGTRGSWTIQEGADDLFLLNRLNGKKYKFKLEEM